MEVIKFNKLEDKGKLKGYLTIKTSEGFEMKGFKLIEGDNGLFVASPSQKGKDPDGNEKWYDMVWIPKELNQSLLDLVGNQVDLSDSEIPF